MSKITTEELLVLQKEKERIKLAVSLKVCPECGSEIIWQRFEDYGTTSKFLFWKWKNGHRWDYRYVCSKNKLHYDYKSDYDMSI